MNIVYIANIRIPTEKAHGIQIMKMCEALSCAGARVECIFPMRGFKASGGVDLFKHYHVKKNFIIKRLHSPDPRYLMKLPDGIYIKLQALFFIISLMAYLVLKKKKSEYIAYTRDEYLLPVLKLFFQRVVWEGHNLPRRRGYYKKFWKKCYKIFVLTHPLKEALERIGVDPKKIFVAPDGVDLERFQVSGARFYFRKMLGLPLDKKIVMHVGHLYAWKGVNSLLDAAEYFQVYYKNFQDVLFVLVGGVESDQKSFEKEKEKRGLANVLILGYRPHQEIPYWLKSADVLIIANSAKEKISRLYTSPLKLFEYMASNIPIVASNVESLREIVNENMVFFFQPDEGKSLAQTLVMVLTSPDTAKNRAMAARKEVEKYTWNIRAKNILNMLYES